MRLRFRTKVSDTAPVPHQVTAAQLNERHRAFYRDGNQHRPGKPIAELRADRFRIETADGFHRIYDLSHDDADPVAEALFKVAEQDRQQVERDRAMVADGRADMPARLSALARLQAP